MKYNIAKLLVVVAALLVLPAYAAVPGGATVNAGNRGSWPAPAPGTIAVSAGNIYNATVNTTMSTYHWVGIYGNATGTLVLGDAASNKMFEWTAQATYVFFDNDTTVDWTQLSDATCTDVETLYPFLTGASDNCANTFTTTGDPAFKSIPDNSANTIEALTWDNTGTGTWVTYAVKDLTNNDVMFVAEVKATPAAAYNGELSNFQAILPESGDNGDTTTTTYYVWIELY